ncbi:MAG: class I SAM-dependent methyltransferase [Candidatus Nealsonbacteria bacterium]|nr:class I SAM-dependent methyltransferase [Candidatus Nealsonbacteria bacterium]
MKQFKDAKGDTWSVIVNGGTIKRAMDLLNIDLGDPLAGKPPLLTRIDTEILLLIDLLFVVCLPQADQREIKDAEFAERLEGDALYAAHEALLEALADVFQKLRRTHIVRALQKQREVVARAVRLADETIDSDAFDAKIDAEMEELGDSFASLLQLPESTPSDNLRPVGEVLSEIGRKMAEMGSGERLGLMNTLFGQRAAASAVKIATTDFDQLSEAIDAADGVAARTAQTMDSGLGGRRGRDNCRGRGIGRGAIPGSVGGAQTECWATVKLWRQAGWDVHLVPTWGRDDTFENRLDEIGCTTHHVGPADLESVPGLAGSVAVGFCNHHFFDHDGTMHAVYHASPHQVLRLSGSRTELLPPTGDALVGCRWGVARGGAPPVLVGDQWYHWFHATTWLPDIHSVYLLGLYTFDAKPPFRVRRTCPMPLYAVDGKRPDLGTPFCVFPCGAVFENGRWLLSMGLWDDRIRLLEIAADEVEQRLAPVNSPDARMVEMVASDGEMDTFWRGWSRLPGWCDRAKAGWLMAAVAQLAEQNPDFVGLEIGVFGGRSLAPVAAALGKHGQALLVGVDAWSAPVAINGLDGAEHVRFWGQQGMLDDAFGRCRQFVERHGLSRSCLLLPVTSTRAAELIAGAIDYLHIDGSHGNGAAHDATLWVPRVRPGGLIVVDDTDGQRWPGVQEAVAVVRQSSELVHDGGDWQAWRKRGA